MIRVLLADDHAVVRKGLRFILEREQDCEVLGEAADGREAVKMAASLEPGIVIMDIAMPFLNGIDATAQIVKHNPRTSVIILSMHSDESYLVRALSAGAKGYLLKDSAESDLVQAVRVVAKGKPFFSPAISAILVEDYLRQLTQRGLQDSYDLLTDREKEVLQLLAEGKTNKEVASLLNVSVYTIETHRNNMMQKLGLHNTAGFRRSRNLFIWTAVVSRPGSSRVKCFWPLLISGRAQAWAAKVQRFKSVPQLHPCWEGCLPSPAGDFKALFPWEAPQVWPPHSILLLPP